MPPWGRSGTIADGKFSSASGASGSGGSGFYDFGDVVAIEDSKVLATSFAPERKHRDVKIRPCPNPEGTGATDDATVPKQKGKKAKEKQDTKNTAKTVQKKPAGKTVAAKKVKVQKQTAGKTAPTMKAMKVKVMKAMNGMKAMKAMKAESEEEAWKRIVANDPSEDVATTEEEEEGEIVSEDDA